MNKYQPNQENILSEVSSMFQSVKQMLENFSKVMHSLRILGSHSRTISKLHPMIQYDIGELDCKPHASTLPTVQLSQQASLDMMKLRSL